LSEILRSEGIVSFQKVQLSDLSSSPIAEAYLQAFQTVLLSEVTLSTTQESLLRNYVAQGGDLVAMRPAAGLASMFGQTRQGERPELLLQFFVVDTSMVAGTGVTPLSLQYHGPADNCALTGGTPLAWFCESMDTVSANPAVVWNRYQLGQAVCFNFNLARSVVLTRQGNPDWSDTEGDNLPGYRPADLFARTSGETWFAPARMRVPQADEAQRFLANIIHSLAGGPLPSLWYLPGNAKAMVINTGDAEHLGGTDLDQTINDAASYGGYFTSYLMQSGVDGTSPAKEAQWRAAGHETGPHVYAGGPDTCDAIGVAYRQITETLVNRFGHGARTARSHTIDWCGWSAMAAIEENYGTGMDLNYYHYFPSLQSGGVNANGYFTGSGLPQRFSSIHPAPMNIYQLATQWPDEWFDNSGYTADSAFEVSRSMLEASRQGFYSALVANIHHIRYDNVAGDITHAWANKLWSYAQSNGIPMWSAEKLLDFVEARNAAQTRNPAWTGGTLTFDFTAPISGQDLTVLVPASLPGKRLTFVEVDGAPVPLQLETLKGRVFNLLTTRAPSARIAAHYAVATNLARAAQTTATEFRSGTLENATVTESGSVDGELRLTPAFYDPFDVPLLGTNWASSSWGGGAFAPALSGQSLSVSNPGDGGFVRSLRAFYPGTKLKGRVLFSKGGRSRAPYVYFGLGGEQLVPWALIGTGAVGDRLYASVYNSRPNDPVTQSLGTSFDTWHVIEIAWEENQIRFAIDGTLQSTQNVSIPGPLYIFLSVADSTPAEAAVRADWISIEGYSTDDNRPGRYTSTVYDAGWLTTWESLSWAGSQPPGTSVSFEARSGNNRALDGSWSPWQVVHGSLQSPASRYIQYRATLRTSNPQVSPVIDQVVIGGTTVWDLPPLRALAVAGEVVLSWPAWADGMAVFSTEYIGSEARWLRSQGSPELRDDRFELRVVTTNQASFFRLETDYGPTRPITSALGSWAQ
jgi:hypothetical protein